jgi:hypothetical protein
MSYTYASWVSSLANMLPVASNDPGFVTVLPNIIDDAEQRLYRDLDLLSTDFSDSTGALVAGQRYFNLPASIATFVVTNQINVITPFGTTNPELGTRNALTPMTREALDLMWPSVNGSTVPVYFAMTSQTAAIVGPWPDQGYQIEVVGTQRPTPLSAANTATFLTTYLPDLWMAASMVYAAAYQKNFGAGQDDPKMALSWEAHLGTLLTSAKTEENRKRFRSEGWSSKQPSPIATPARV